MPKQPAKKPATKEKGKKGASPYNLFMKEGKIPPRFLASKGACVGAALGAAPFFCHAPLCLSLHLCNPLISR